MSSNAELAAVLLRTAGFAGHDDVDTGWSAYEADELRSEIASFLGQADAGRPLDEAGRAAASGFSSRRPGRCGDGHGAVVSEQHADAHLDQRTQPGDETAYGRPRVELTASLLAIRD